MRRMVFMIAVLGCSSGGGSHRMVGGAGEGAPTVCASASSQSCMCSLGASDGVDQCGRACTCPPADNDFGNSTGSVETSTVDNPVTAAPQARPACEPGLYLGQYQCEVTVAGLPFPLAGDVSFNLAVNEEVVPAEECQEFCADLVIAEGTGTLFGLAGIWGFEAALEGGLDCQTGEFRASAPTGVYGAPISSDPADPNALWTVQQPAFGMFTGSLQGTHTTDAPQAISGEWNLADMAFGATCVGPFDVVLQP